MRSDWKGPPLSNRPEDRAPRRSSDRVLQHGGMAEPQGMNSRRVTHD
jgi:hypothetical protein